MEQRLRYTRTCIECNSPISQIDAPRHTTTETVTPLYDLCDGQHHRTTVPAVPHTLVPAEGRLTNARGRRLHDLCISVIDCCNFHCVYCMPKDVFDKDYRFLRHSELLLLEEIE